MGFILCSSTVVVCLISQVISQPPPKPTGEWSPDRPLMYPNPWVDFAKCNRANASGLCDVNAILTQEERDEFGEMLQKLNEGRKSEDLCTPNRINVTVAIMKQIGPHIQDYRKASSDFAVKFRELWSLGDCSVIVIASKFDSTSFIEAGTAVKALIPGNKTEEIDRDIYENYFKQGLFVEGLNETIIQYRKALEREAAQTTTPHPDGQSSSPTKVIVGVIIGVLVVAIIILLIVIFLRLHKKKANKLQVKEQQQLNSAQAV